jgi:hypothetical protein
MGFFKRSKVGEAKIADDIHHKAHQEDSKPATSNIRESLTKVATHEGPPTRKEEKKRKKLYKKEFEERKKERSYRIQALLDKSREHREGV